MKKMPLQKLTLAAIALFLMVSCSKDDAPATVVKAEVTIGTQVWATKNLDVATYSDGTLIRQVTDPTQWAALKTGAWCYYDNYSSNGTTLLTIPIFSASNAVYCSHKNQISRAFFCPTQRAK